MSIDPELLHMLVCPETHKPLRPASPELLARVNDLIRTGGARTCGGEAVTEELVEGLVPEGEDRVYPIRDEIPILLRHEAIPLPRPSGR